MQKNIVTTVFGQVWQASAPWGLTVTPPANSTINELMGNATVVPYQPSPATLASETVAPYNPSVDTPNARMGFYIIGNRGHTMITDPTTHIPVATTLEHDAEDAGLYGMIPFVAVPLASDLSPADRANYRLRQIMNIGGALFATYWAKIFTPSASAAQMLLQVTTDGVTVSTNFVPTINNLIPTPPAVGAESPGTALSTTVPASIVFDATDFANLQAACELVYGTSAVAIVSEIGICYGVDHPVLEVYPSSGTQTPAPVTYSVNEVVALQVAVHITDYNNGPFEEDLDMGITEPIYGTQVGS